MVNFENIRTNTKVPNYDSSTFDASKIPEEANLQKHLKDLREIISKDEKLRCPLDDESLTYFIRGRKYNVARAYKTIKSFFNLLSTSPEFLSTLYPSAQADLFFTPGFLTVSKCRSQGTQIFTIRIGLWDTAKFDPESMLISLLITLIHLVKTSVETNVSGVHIIIDFEGFSIYHLRLFTIRRIRKMLTMVQDGFPVRIKGIHLLNNSEVVRLGYNLAKPFLKEKLRKRVHFYGHKYQEALCCALGDNAVPESRGGNVPDQDYELSEFYPELLTQDDVFKSFLTSGYGYGTFIYWKEFGRSS